MNLTPERNGTTIARYGDLYLNPDPDGAEAYVCNGDPSALEAHFSPMPECRNQVACHIHCVGPSGCGKTTWANGYAKAFREFTGGSVVCISADVEDDPNLDCEMRIGVSTPEFAALRLDDFIPENRLEDPPVLIIFDDIEGLPAAEMKAVRVFEQATKERGRKFNVHSISVYHKGASNNNTKSSLSEATKFVVFPGHINANTTYMLDKYAGLKPEITAMINRGKWGRWCEITPGQTVVGTHRAIKFDSAKLLALAKAEKKRAEAEAVKHVQIHS